MMIKKAWLVVDGDEAFRTLDTIEHQGKVWLVTKWSIDQGGRTRRPAIIISGPALLLDPVQGIPGIHYISRLIMPKPMFYHGFSATPGIEVQIDPPGLVDGLESSFPG